MLPDVENDFDAFDRVRQRHSIVSYALSFFRGYCRVLCLASCLLLSMLIIASTYSALSALPPTLSGAGCDALLAPGHAQNRTVGIGYCVQHNAALSTLNRKFSLPADSFRFVVVGDFGRDGLCCQRDVATEMAIACAQLNCSWVLNIGDAFYNDGLLQPNETQVDTSWRDVYLVHPELRTTPYGWFSVLGNHEYRGSPGALLQLAAEDKRFVMPDRNYSKVLQAGAFKMLFVVLDTSPMIPVYHQDNFEADNKMLNSSDGIRTQWDRVPAQLAWLRDTLAAHSDIAVKIVCGHHPVYTSGSHYGEDQGFLRQYLAPVLEQFKVSVYFSGHDHNLQYHHKSASSVYYFGSGAGSKVEGSFVQPDDGLRFFEQVNGFLAVEASAAGVRVAVVDYTGLVLLIVDVPVSTAQAAAST